MRVINFVRVSKQQQDYRRQMDDLNAFAKKNDYRVVKTIKEKISGATDNSEREAIRELLALAKRGSFDKLLCWEISRLGRNTHQVLSVVSELNKLNIPIYIHNHQIQTIDDNGNNNPVGQLLITLLSEFSRMEREVLIERIKSGLNQARKKGVKLGRPKNTFKTKEQLLSQYKDVVEYLNLGISLRKISKLCGVSVNTIQKVKNHI